MSRTVLGFLLLPPLVAAQAAAQAPRPTTSLSSLLPAPDTLPACAKVLKIEPGKDLPCGIKTNPIVSRDRAFVSCMADVVLAKLAKDAGVTSKQVAEAAFVEYEAGSEIGVMAFAFEDAASASAVSKAFEQAAGTEASTAALASGTAVGFLSCDPGVEEACCRQVRAMVVEIWKKAPGAAR